MWDNQCSYTAKVTLRSSFDTGESYRNYYSHGNGAKDVPELHGKAQTTSDKNKVNKDTMQDRKKQNFSK